jgi:Flp pilus assembly secretin CpaC
LTHQTPRQARTKAVASRLGRVSLFVLISFLFATCASAQSDSLPFPVAVAATVPDSSDTSSAQHSGVTELHLLVGRSLVLTSPANIRRVSIADPSIADVMVLSANQVLVNAKSPGGVSLVLWNENEQSQKYEVNVDLDLGNLSERVHDAFPEDQVRLEASKDTLILSGRVSSKEESDKIFHLFLPSSRRPSTCSKFRRTRRRAKSCLKCASQKWTSAP